jgi:hypothetical protein
MERCCWTVDSVAVRATIKEVSLMATATAENLASRLARRGVVQADLSCMMCGRMVGQIVDGRVVHRAGCGGQLRVDRGVLRCCQCGGSIYRESVTTLIAR